jgi:branched-chain amino acid transport system substrate-binding protein
VPEELFLACFGDNVQAAAGAEYAFNTLQAKTAYVIYDESTEYTRLLQQYFVTRFQELGGKVIGSQSFTPASVDKLSLEAAKADLIFLSAGPHEALLGVRRLRELGLDQPILGGDGFDSNVWAEAPEVDNVYYTTHVYLGDGNTRPVVVKFRQDYSARYPDTPPDAFAALGYDTVNLLVAAIRKAGSAEPDAIRGALAGMQGFEGVTGTISYTDGERIPIKTVSLLKLSKGKPELMSEVLPHSVPHP